MATTTTDHTHTGTTDTPGACAAQPVGATDEVADLKAQLRHAQKLACLGTTAAMLAHEYNNIYCPMVSYAQYALDQDDVTLMRKALKMILGHSDMAQAMSERILGLLSQNRPKPQPLNLHQLLDDSMTCLGRDLAKDGITLTVQIDEGIIVSGFQSQLQQVFLNLILNARQALLGRKGHLKITATPISGDAVTIHVRDNGKGIKEDDLARIFEPFFTTKQDEDRQDKRGIGLGLAVSRDIVREHGGNITVESIEGHGTTFTVTLPTTAPETAGT